MAHKLVAALTAGLCLAGIGIGVAQAVQGDTVNTRAPQTDPEYLTDSAARGRITTHTATTSTITGRVTGTNGTPAPGYLVEAYTPDGNFLADTRTRTDGRYTLPSLQLGPYKIKASPTPGGTPTWAPTWAGNTPGLLTATTYTLTTTPRTINLTLPKAATLTGKITALPPRPATLTACGQSFLDCRTTPLTPTGKFTITGLPPGTTNITLHTPNHPPLSFPKQPPRPGIRLTPGATTTIGLNATTQKAPTTLTTTP